VVVTIPGQQPITYNGAARYVSEITGAARASLASLGVAMEEILQTAADLDSRGALDDLSRGEIDILIELALRAAEDQVLVRSRSGGGNWRSPEIAELWQETSGFLLPLIEAARSYTP
jgi:hypothetical protein